MQCFVCGTKARFFCRQCKGVRYCSQMCQKDHWPRHRKVCGSEHLDVCKHVAQVSGGKVVLEMTVDKGRGLVAACDMPAGTRLFTDTGVALCMMDVAGIRRVPELLPLFACLAWAPGMKLHMNMKQGLVMEQVCVRHAPTSTDPTVAGMTIEILQALQSKGTELTKDEDEDLKIALECLKEQDKAFREDNVLLTFMTNAFQFYPGILGFEWAFLSVAASMANHKCSAGANMEVFMEKVIDKVDTRCFRVSVGAMTNCAVKRGQQLFVTYDCDTGAEHVSSLRKYDVECDCPVDVKTSSQRQTEILTSWSLETSTALVASMKNVGRVLLRAESPYCWLRRPEEMKRRAESVFSPHT